MGLLDNFFDIFCGDDGEDEWWLHDNRKHTVPGTNGKRRYIVGYITINGMPCAAEIIANTGTSARECVRCRSDVKYVTYVNEI